MPKILPSVGFVTQILGTSSPYSVAGTLTQGTTDLYSLSQAVSFGWLSNGDEIYYTCRNGSGAMECGVGTYNAGTNTVARTTALLSTNSNGMVNWGNGNKSFFCDLPSTRLMTGANNLSEILNQDAAQGNLGATATGKALFIAVSQAAARTALGLGGLATLGTADIPTYNFATGVKTTFTQAAAPVAWTKSTTNNDRALRVVSGSGGGTGGTRPLSSGRTEDHTLTIAQLPTHDHPAFGGAVVQSGTGAFAQSSFVGLTDATGERGGGDPHFHTVSLQYLDVIECVKN